MMLLTLTPDKVLKLINEYEKDTEEIKKSALSMSWYMRGGVSYEDVLNMSQAERLAISAIIEQNLDTTKKSQLPFF
jgi:hypothetical protein